jgi:hypothetical protein
VFATVCGFNSPDIASTRLFSCSIIPSPGFLPIVVYDHRVFTTSYELNSPDITSARPSSCPINRSPGFVPNVANAHSVFATVCNLAVGIVQGGPDIHRLLVSDILLLSQASEESEESERMAD